MIPQIAWMALTVVGIVVDWYWSSELNNAASQLESLLAAIQYGTTFEEFLADCWLFVLIGIGFVVMLLFVAFPKKKNNGVRP